jgi:alkylation response protein AidB-like acyl-CoA dehydrogenase
MDFDFSDEQYMFQRSVRELLDRDLGIEQLRKGIPATLWTNLADLGIFAILAPEKDGGLDLGFTDLALIFEEFGRALMPSPVVTCILAGAMVARFGTAKQRQLLATLADGSARMTLAVVDPMTGPGTLAEREGDHWRLTGRKILVCDAASADRLLVVATFDGEPALFLVPRTQDGVSLSEQRTLDLTSPWHAVTFEAAEAELLGATPDADAVGYLNDAGAATSALLMTGISARVLDEAIGYVSQAPLRRSGGGCRILSLGRLLRSLGP